jgi:colicin import membrane protein
MNVLTKYVMAAFLVCAASLANAEMVYDNVESGLLSVYPAGSIMTNEKADAALATVDQFTASAEARYLDEQRVCYTKFFAQRCLDTAKDNHRVTIKAIRQVDIEANRYKRQARADESERSLNERNASREANKPK